MNGFLIKKSFFDGWDILIGMVLGFNHRPGRYQGRC